MYDQNIFGPSLVVFANLRLSSVIFGKWLEILGKCSEKLVWPSDKFWKTLEIFGIIRKLPQMLLCIVNILCNKEKITWLLGDTKFIFSCWKMLHSFTATTREIFFNTQRQILYLCAATWYPLYISWQQSMYMVPTPERHFI